MRILRGVALEQLESHPLMVKSEGYLAGRSSVFVFGGLLLALFVLLRRELCQESTQEW